MASEGFEPSHAGFKPAAYCQLGYEAKAERRPFRMNLLVPGRRLGDACDQEKRHRSLTFGSFSAGRNWWTWRDSNPQEARFELAASAIAPQVHHFLKIWYFPPTTR